MKFIADCMLGTLSKWLLILGHDVVYLSRVEDGELVRMAVAEKRTILTRDRKRAAACLDFRPRCLHPAGQVHGGGRKTGVFPRPIGGRYEVRLPGLFQDAAERRPCDAGP